MGTTSQLKIDVEVKKNHNLEGNRIHAATYCRDKKGDVETSREG